MGSAPYSAPEGFPRGSKYSPCFWTLGPFQVSKPINKLLGVEGFRVQGFRAQGFLDPEGLEACRTYVERMG